MRAILIYVSYGVIFLTGAAGLVYQVTWQKYLSRILGADSLATAIILGTFLGGLSLGYFLCAKLSTRIKQQLRAFALLEGMIGLWCLAFPAIFTAIDGLTRSWSFAAPVAILFQGFLCSALLIGVPTICMGGTVPLMTRGISRNIAEATGIHAMVYSINTAGAVLGALLAGFYLIPRFGLPATVMGTSVVNIGACLFFLGISRLITAQPAEAVESADEAPPAGVRQDGLRFPAPVLYGVAFASGFYVMLLENVFIRFTGFSLGGSSYSFSLIVAVFILAIAAGSFAVSRLPRIPRSTLFWNQLLIGVLLFLVYLSLDTWSYWAHLIRIGSQSNAVGFWQYYVLVFIALTALLILPVACMGATIPLAFHELKRDLHTVGRHSGQLLSWNTIGSLTGSIIGGIVFYYFLDSQRIFLFAVLLAAGSVCILARSLTKTYLVSGGVLAGLALLALLIAPFYDQDRFKLGTFIMRQMLPHSLNGPRNFYEIMNRGTKLLFHDDDPVASVAVVNTGMKPPFRKPNLAIVINGKSDSSTTGDIYTTRLLSHLPALLAKKRDEVLVIGLGTGVSAGELTLYPDIKAIEVAEISPAVVAALPHFAESTNRLHEDPRLKILAGDAFRILGRSQKKWDIIISEPSNPWVTGVDLLFTREFYKTTRAHLTDDGLFVQWVQNYAASREMLGMIMHTVQQEFPQSRVFWSTLGDLFILASVKPLALPDIRRAETLFRENNRVREALVSLNLPSVDSLLLREIWTPSYIQSAFADSDVQTLDKPRLHYLAGKDFFIGRDMDYASMLDTLTVNFIPEYLLAMKYPDWKTRVLSKEEYEPLAISLTSVVNNTQSPALPGLSVKAFLGNPRMYPISYQQFQEMGLDVLQFIVTPDHRNLDWGRIGLANAGYRQKAMTLFEHVQKTRNWIVPYPLAGLESLLEQGMSAAKDPTERTWCALQLSLLLNFQGNADKGRITAILDRVRQLPVADQDRKLLERVNSMVQGLP